MLFWFAALPLAGLLVYALAANIIIFRMYTQPMRAKIWRRPEELGVAAQQLEIRKNGIVNPGWLLFPPGHTSNKASSLIIVQHGFGAERSEVLDRAVALAKAGYLVYQFDWRGHGENRAKRSSGGLLEQDDLLAVARHFVKDRRVENLALYGVSMGATIAIAAAARCPQIRCVVADAPFDALEHVTRDIMKRFPLGRWLVLPVLRWRYRQTFGESMVSVNAAAAAGEISPRPLLILTGTDDSIVRHEFSMAVFNSADEPKQLKIQQGGGHFDNAAPHLLNEVIIPFFRKHLPLESETG